MKLTEAIETIKLCGKELDLFEEESMEGLLEVDEGTFLYFVVALHTVMSLMVFLSTRMPKYIQKYGALSEEERERIFQEAKGKILVES